jgi:sodium/potassium-transporting ATPase subunit alpha
LTILIWKF